MTLFGMLPVLGLFTATMRYSADFASGAFLLAALGFFGLVSRFERRPAARRAVFAVASLLAAYTLVFSALLGFRGGGSHFERVNPELYQVLARALSLCG
jgi:hypothetical protein